MIIPDDSIRISKDAVPVNEAGSETHRRTDLEEETDHVGLLCPEYPPQLPCELFDASNSSFNSCAQLPPPYSPSSQDSEPAASPSPSTSAQPRAPPPPPDLPPTNYLNISKQNNAIREKYILDLGVHPLPGSTPTPDHLVLDSHNGSVTAEVWVRGSQSAHDTRDPDAKVPLDVKRERARMRFLGHNGRVSVRVHLDPSGPAPRPHLSIHLASHNGATSLTIPSSFHGQLTLYTVNGRMTLSEAVERRAATLREERGTRIVFVGPRPLAWRTGNDEGNTAESDAEEVDDAYVGTKNGAVRVEFDDEVEERGSASGVWSSFMKVLGM